MKTRMTELLGIKYPIMQGGMQHLGVPELAAAVSEAGGLGTINVTIYPDPEDLRKAIKEVKAKTDKKFFISMIIFLCTGNNIDRRFGTNHCVCRFGAPAVFWGRLRKTVFFIYDSRLV